jgi:hypothetical protein
VKWHTLPDAEYGSYREHAACKPGDRIRLLIGGEVLVVGWVNPFGVPVTGDPKGTPNGRYINEAWFSIERTGA